MDSMPSGKLVSLQINSPPLGEYDECLSIESPDTNDTEKPKIFGHYCSMGVPTNLIPKSNEDHIEDFRRLGIMYTNKMKEYLNGTERGTDGKMIYDLIRFLEYLGGDMLRLPTGLCLPSTCRPKDVEYAINKILFPMTRINMIIHPDCDYRDKPVHIDEYQIISIISIVLITLVCVICTTIWLLRDRLPKATIDGQPMSSLFRITDCFSIIPNLKAIFDTSKTVEKFSAMDGIRAILCFWIFMEHEYLSGLIPVHTKKMRQSAPFKFSYQLRYIFLINHNLTDTFFLIGGFMTCYILLSKLEKSRGKFNYIQYALYRYFRMIPIILTAIAITFVLELIGDGPIWPLISYIVQKPCVDYYLPTILMYNNFIFAPKIMSCVQISWYSSADFQLYLMAPGIILVLYHWPRVGLIWNITVVILGIVLALAPKLWFGVPHIFELLTTDKALNLDLLAQVFSRHFFGIEAHVQFYALGILVGYVLRKYPNLYLGGRWGEVLIWLSTWTLTFYAIFWHRNYYNLAEYRVTESEVINWIAFSKISYAAGWSWAFYACCTGRAGFINKFFSWKGFKPIAYLMLEIYILHVFLIMYRIGTTRELIFYSDYYVWTVVIFDFILTFILALIVNVLVTKPFANLLDVFMKRSNKKEILDDINNNNLIFNSNGKLGSDEDNVSDVIVLKNVVFDSDSVVLTDKQLINDTILRNLDNSNTIDCNTDCNKESALKM